MGHNIKLTLCINSAINSECVLMLFLVLLMFTFLIFQINPPVGYTDQYTTTNNIANGHGDQIVSNKITDSEGRETISGTVDCIPKCIRGKVAYDNG